MALSRPIDILQVRGALGETAYDLKSLCTSSKINRWAKYKPVPQPSIYPYTDANWWKGINLNCGLSYNTYTNVGQLVSAVVAGTSDWTYIRPTGGLSDLYRLLDFDGYDHAAVCPVGELEVPSVAQIGQNKTLDVFVPYRTGLPTSVSLTDIGGASGLPNMYFGAVLYRTKDGIYQWQTSATKLGAGGGCQIAFDLSGILAGDYVVYPFLTDVQRTNPVSPDVAADIVPLPKEVGIGKAVKLQDASPAYSYVVSVTKVGLGEYTYRVVINNTHTTSLTFREIYLTLYQKEDGNLVIGDEQPIYNDTVTIAAGSAKTYSGTVYALEAEFKMWRFVFKDYLGNSYTKQGYF